MNYTATIIIVVLFKLSSIILRLLMVSVSGGYDPDVATGASRIQEEQYFMIGIGMKDNPSRCWIINSPLSSFLRLPTKVDGFIVLVAVHWWSSDSRCHWAVIKAILEPFTVNNWFPCHSLSLSFSLSLSLSLSLALSLSTVHLIYEMMFSELY